MTDTLLTLSEAEFTAEQSQDWYGIFYEAIEENMKTGGSFYPIFLALGMVVGGVISSCVMEDCERLNVSEMAGFDPADGLHLRLIRIMQEMIPTMLDRAIGKGDPLPTRH